MLPYNLKGAQEIEFFKPINLHDLYGSEFIFNNRLDNEMAEKMCLNMFYGLSRTNSFHSNRGDFVYESEFYDQKTVKFCSKLPTGKSGSYFKIKYSNVNSKMFVQIVFRELDKIIHDIKTMGKWDNNRHMRLSFIRYRTEMSFDDMWYVDDMIIRGENATSFCGRNKVRFLHYVDVLCGHNVRRFANIIAFHEPTCYDEKHRWLKDDGINYYCYRKEFNYVVTVIDIKKVTTYVDYIGFGGFKIYTTTRPVTTNLNVNKLVTLMKDELDELDNMINLITHLNHYKQSYEAYPWEEKGAWFKIPFDDYLKEYGDKDIKDWEYSCDPLSPRSKRLLRKCYGYSI